MDLVLLFDLDGTLTDSREGIVKSVRYALEKLSLPIPPEETLLRFIGPPLEDSFQRCCGLTEGGAAEAVRLYRDYYARQRSALEAQTERQRVQKMLVEQQAEDSL